MGESLRYRLPPEKISEGVEKRRSNEGEKNINIFWGSSGISY